MATLSVLNYSLPSGLTMKLNQNSNLPNSGNTGNSLSKTFNKITVQNVLSENNVNALNISSGNPNAIVRKIKDFGMSGAVNNATGAASLSINPRKRPLMEAKQNRMQVENKLSAPANKKPKLTKEERAAIRAAKKAAKENANSIVIAGKEPLALLQQTVKIPGTPGRKGLPLPQAVARRNARERNRVKQVNNGFAALRERIPEEVAEVFETQSSKAAGKKLSKVETLRMAVEYIRSLERLLGFDFPIGGGGGNGHPHFPLHTSSSGEESFSLIKDEFDAYSPSMDEQFDDSLSHYDNEEYFQANPNHPYPIPSSTPHPMPEMDMLPNITTLNGLQYIRIPGTNTYQLLTPDIFVGTASSPPSSTIDEEHFNALIDTNCVSPSSSSVTSITSPIQQQQQHLQQHQQQQHGITNSNTADLHNTTATTSPPPPSSATSSSATSINSLEVLRRVQETAPVLITTVRTTTNKTENINEEGSKTLLSSSSSSLSPVPHNNQQQQILTTTTSPSSSPVLHQQTLSPASTNDHHQTTAITTTTTGLRQTCAANHQQQQQHRQQEFLLSTTATITGQQIGTLHMIKQEFEEPSHIYQQQQLSPTQQQQHQIHHQQQQSLYHTVNSTNMSMSPPIDRNTPTTSSTSASTSVLHSFYNHESTSTYYENVATLKKEFNDVLLDASHNNNVLSDESIIDAIDWWDAHTPKSDGGSVIM